MKDGEFDNVELNSRAASDAASPAKRGYAPSSSQNGLGGLVPAVAAGSPAIPAASVDPRALLSSFRRRWFLAISIGLIGCVVAAAAAWRFAPAPYVAFSELLIKAVPERILYRNTEPVADFPIYKQSQMRLVKSPAVYAAALRDPKVSSLSLIQQEERPMDWLDENLEVTSPAKEFIRISISLSGEEISELPILVNAITKAFIEEEVNAVRNGRQDHLKRLEKIHRSKEETSRIQRRDLEILAKRLHTTNLETLTVQQQMAIEYYAQLRQQYARVRFDVMMAEVQQDSTGKTAADIDIPPSIIEDRIEQMPKFQDAESQVKRAERRLTKHQQTLDSNHPQLVKIERELQTLQNKLEIIRAELQPRAIKEMKDEISARQEIDNVTSKERTRLLKIELEYLQKELDGQKIVEQETGIQSVKLELLRKDITQSEGVTQRLADEINRVEIELQSKPRIKLLRKAETPGKRKLTTKYQLTAFAGLGSFAVLAGGIVWLDFRSKRISILNDVSTNLSMRVLGSLPNVPRSASNGSFWRNSERDAYWHNRLTESIDSARTMLLRDAQRDSIKVVMITSATAGEGKTTLCCHMATSLVRAGRRVLLVDCDLRWPSIHTVFDRNLAPGLCEVLRGEVQLQTALQPASQDGLSILSAGQVNQDVLKALASNGMEIVFERLKDEFDFVIVDSSPVLPVADSLLIAQFTDAVMFSIRRDVSRMEKVSAACLRMEMLGIPILGAVVIGLDDSSYGFGFPYRSRRSYRYASDANQEDNPQVSPAS